MASTSLTQLAQQCVDHLRQPKIIAENLLSSQQPKLLRLVLQGTVQDLENHQKSLSDWKAKAATGIANKSYDTKSYNIAVAAATDLLALIHERTSAVEETLRRAQGSNSLSEKDRLLSSCALSRCF